MTLKVTDNQNFRLSWR